MPLRASFIVAAFFAFMVVANLPPHILPYWPAFAVLGLLCWVAGLAGASASPEGRARGPFPRL